MGTFHKMTPKEIEAWELVVSFNGSSSYFEDQVCGVLMDFKIGNFGLNEDDAKVKAKAIAHLAESWLESGRHGWTNQTTEV